MGERVKGKLKSQRAVFLDRDGVLTVSTIRDGKGYAPLKFDEFRFFLGVTNCVDHIKRLGFIPIIVSNQPDVANGKLPIEVLEQMNQKLREKLGITEINNCTHSNEDSCRCRKPKPGMLLDSALRLNLDLNHSWMIGDRDSDIAAGLEAGCKTIFINRHLKAELGEHAHLVCESLEEAIDLIAKYDS